MPITCTITLYAHAKVETRLGQSAYLGQIGLFYSDSCGSPK